MGLFSKKNKEVAKDTVSQTAKDSASKQASDQLKVVDKKVKDLKNSQPKSKKVTVKTDGQKSAGKNAQAYRFLLRPVISEKATISVSDGKYTFEVSGDANKVAIKKAIEEIYGVKPTRVNIINQGGKHVRFGRKFGQTKNVKKAIVTLKKGDSIKLYEGI